FFFSSRRRHTRCLSDWSSDVCSSDLISSYHFDTSEASDLPITPEDRVVRAGDASVGVRVFRPDGDARAVYLDIHGGGFYLGSARSEEHTSELQSLRHLVCRLLLEKKK